MPVPRQASGSSARVGPTKSQMTRKRPHSAIPRVPGYVRAQRVTVEKLETFEKAINHLSTELDGFHSDAGRRYWRRNMLRTAASYVASLEALVVLLERDRDAFDAAALGMFESESFREVAVAREVYFSRRKRHRGRGQRGLWLDTNGRRRRKQPTVGRIRSMARCLTLDQPSTPAHRLVMRKANGHRVTFAFSLPDQAYKRIAADIVEVVCTPNQFDYGRHNKGGHHGAAVEIRRSISRGECRHFAVADLRDAYPSITAGHIAEAIPLPGIVIRNVITIPAGLTTVVPESPQPTGRRLPQGAVSSAVTLSVLLGRSLRQVAGPRRMIVNQGDDIAIGTPTRAEAVLALRELEERLTSLRAGPLRLRTANIQSPFDRQKLNYCGYAHRWFTDSRRLHCAPSDKSIEKMKVKLRGKLEQAGAFERERLLRSYLRSWSDSFPCWTRNKYSVSSIETTAQMMLSRVRMAESDRRAIESSQRQQVRNAQRRQS